VGKRKVNNAPLFTCTQAAFTIADKSGKRAFHGESEFAHDCHERRHASVITRPPKAPDFLTLPPSAASKRIAGLVMVIAHLR